MHWTPQARFTRFGGATGGIELSLSAIMLVGGRGTRLQPLTDVRPKPMLPVVDVPFLEHQLAWLRAHGITRVTFACGFMPQGIVAYFGDGSRVGMELSYVVEPEPLGTGGAIGFAARSVERGRLVVCNGDVLTTLDLGTLIATHEQHGAAATIALTPVDDPSRYGLVRVAEDGRVAAFLEKPKPEEIDTNLINAGTYILEPSVLDLIAPGVACSVERDVFPRLVDNGLYAMASDAYWTDMGTVPSYLAATFDVLRGRVRGAAANPAGSVLVDGSAHVSPGAKLHAPAYIGAGATVADDASVGPDAVIAAGARIEAGARVVRSIVLERAVIGREAHVDRSIVGDDASVPPRCSVADGAVVAPGETVNTPLLRGTFPAIASHG